MLGLCVEMDRTAGSRGRIRRWFSVLHVSTLCLAIFFQMYIYLCNEKNEKIHRMLCEPIFTSPFYMYSANERSGEQMYVSDRRALVRPDMGGICPYRGGALPRRDAGIAFQEFYCCMSTGLFCLRRNKSAGDPNQFCCKEAMAETAMMAGYPVEKAISFARQ